jgi:hypothetical protein
LTDGQWGGEGLCKETALLPAGSGQIAELVCDLADNHPDLHWDKGHWIVWTRWTLADEERVNT